MKKTSEIILLAVLLASSIFSLIFTSLTVYTIGLKQYIGLAGILLTVLIRIKSRKFSNILLGVVLLAGTLNLIEFFFITYSFSLFGLTFNPIILIMLILLVAVNGHSVEKLVGGKTLTYSEKMALLEKDIKIYKDKFSTKSITELQEIINNPDSYTEPAVMASKQLIKEKNIG